MALRYVPGEPEEGALTLGVVFHYVREREIFDATGYEPIGYVVDDAEQEEEVDW